MTTALLLAAASLSRRKRNTNRFLDHVLLNQSGGVRPDVQPTSRTRIVKNRRSLRTGLCSVVLALVFSAASPLWVTVASARDHRADVLADSLRTLGYENVAVYATRETTYVAYENRCLRNDTWALFQAYTVAKVVYGSATTVVLSPTKRRIPLVDVTFPKMATEQTPGDGNSTSPGIERKRFVWAMSTSRFPHSQQAPSPLRKVDIVLHPQLKLQLGDMNDPVKYQLNLAPALSVMPWTGGRLILQVVVPLHNELEPAESRIRAGLLALNQLWRLPWDTFVSASCGYFTSYRYGLDLRVSTYPLRGRLALFGTLGRTGYAFIQGRTIYYSQLDRTTYSLAAWYRFSYSDLSLGTALGRFLYGDNGWRVDIVRRFGELRLGFFALLTELGRNGGFTLSIPLPQRSYPHPGRFRFRVARRFIWEYRYRALRNPGREYWTGFNDPLLDLDAPHLENEFRLYELQQGR